jgi:hypothetical protein
MISNEVLMREVELRQPSAKTFAMHVLKVFCGFFSEPDG